MTFPSHSQPRHVVCLGRTEIVLLGTAHVSRASAEAVARELEGGRFDAVAVELCPSRYQGLLEPGRLAETDLVQVVRRRRAFSVAATLALGAFQQRLAEQLGIEPGAEMRRAVELARAGGLPVLLVDREIGVTLRRVYHAVPWWRRLGLVAALGASVVSREQVSEAEIERLKEGDMLEAAFSEFRHRAPGIFRALIEERDAYMAARLRQECAKADRRRILVVLGAGHLAGVARALEQPDPSRSPEAVIAALEHLPPPSPWPRRLAWLVVVVILSGFAAGFSRSPDLGWTLVAEWVLINGGLSALGALAAAAHPFTVAAAFLAAPLTSLNPTIGAGMVTGAVEALLRRPRVGDFERLRHDSASLRGWWRNRVTRVLLVFILSTLGSAAGTWLAGFRIADRLLG